MFDHAIAGFDGHDGGRDAIAMAAALCPRRLTVVMAYGPQTIVAPTMIPEYWTELRDDAERRLAAACAELGVEADTLVVADTSAARALHQAATEHRADLLVVGSAQRGRVGRLLIGDVSSAVLVDAPCAVVVAPKHLRDAGWTLARVGVAFDGSADAAHALEVAAAIAHDREARLTVFTAWHETTAAADYPYALERAAYDGKRNAQGILDEGLALAGPTATGRLIHGATHRALRDATEDVDLMVVGSRGWGPVQRVLLGSTSHRLVHDGRCPVLVVPRTAVTERVPSSASRQAVTAAPIL